MKKLILSILALCAFVSSQTVAMEDITNQFNNVDTCSQETLTRYNVISNQRLIILEEERLKSENPEAYKTYESRVDEMMKNKTETTVGETVVVTVIVGAFITFCLMTFGWLICSFIIAFKLDDKMADSVDYMSNLIQKVFHLKK